MPRDPEDVAGELYTAYCDAVGWVNFEGDPLPDWEEFREDPDKVKQKEGWVRVAEVALKLSGQPPNEEEEMD